MTDYSTLIRALTASGVEFIIVGGAAAVAHGSARLTQDLDIVYRRSPENIRRLVNAIAPFKPYLRGAPPGLPFQWDERTVMSGLNFTLSTALGDLDLLGELTGGSTYETLLQESDEIEIFQVKCYCLGLRALIRVKRAVGRPKDLEVLAELEAILKERDRDS